MRAASLSRAAGHWLQLNDTVGVMKELSAFGV
jgi:hypothetical protein